MAITAKIEGNKLIITADLEIPTPVHQENVGRSKH
jgi:hypothetical protein